MVTPNEREKYWTKLSYYYMTEESDEENDLSCIVEHKLPWRSNSGFNNDTLSFQINSGTKCGIVGQSGIPLS